MWEFQLTSWVAHTVDAPGKKVAQMWPDVVVKSLKSPTKLQLPFKCAIISSSERKNAVTWWCQPPCFPETQLLEHCRDQWQASKRLERNLSSLRNWLDYIPSKGWQDWLGSLSQCIVLGPVSRLCFRKWNTWLSFRASKRMGDFTIGLSFLPHRNWEKGMTVRGIS